MKLKQALNANKMSVINEIVFIIIERSTSCEISFNDHEVFCDIVLLLHFFGDPSRQTQ